MRVLVLREEEAGRRTARALGESGHAAVVAPATRIVASHAPPPCKKFDALLATSAQAFRFEDPALKTLRPRPMFVVGAATGEAARRHGFADIRLCGGDADALVDLVRLTLPHPARLLYLAGRDRKPMVEQALGDAGYRVEAWIRYEAAALPAWDGDVVEAIGAGKLDAALHFSRRGVELALILAERHDVRAAFLALRHGCLSADVAAPLRAAGAARIAVATRPDEASLLAVLAAA